ncbi:MAG TPA: potassium transporter TrkG [Anaerohalosphaeraceae bacterium]|nr:potassium transporter TrkG [Anaerohalosphaeraceae bacterium]
MKIHYKNAALERLVIAANGLAAASAAGTFVLLYGFDRVLLPTAVLYAAQFISLLIFLAEKAVRFANAESRREFLKYNWFEIPLLSILLLSVAGAGHWFSPDSSSLAILIAIDTYLVLQVIVKVCRTMVAVAATGKNPPRALAGLFVILIAAGSGLLMLPRSNNVEHLSFTDAVFTAASATCVTGLVVKDTGSDFTPMGQVIILTLIQLGGLGIVTFGAVMALILGQALSVQESAAMQDLLNTQTLSRIVRMIAFIFLTTLLIEAVGALVLYPMWKPMDGRFSTPEGRWFCSIFHSVSAFCNAGFSLFSDNLSGYRSSPQVYLVIAPLIVVGGLGFSVLYNLLTAAQDVLVRFFHRRMHPGLIFAARSPVRLQLQTKIVLTVSALLIVGGTGALLLFESCRPEGPYKGDILTAFFHSVSARTAGFNTVDIASLSEASRFILIVLMFIGGSPGSTAGGIKTVTFAVVVMIAWASFRKRRDVEMFRRSIRLLIVGRAVTVVFLFGLTLLTATLGLAITERHSHFAFLDLLFEAASALATVGLSTGITPSLTAAGKWIIIFTMLIGRLGPLTLLAGLTHEIKPAGFDYPSEPVVVG